MAAVRDQQVCRPRQSVADLGPRAALQLDADNTEIQTEKDDAARKVKALQLKTDGERLFATGEYRETSASDGSTQLSVLYQDGANLEHRCLAFVVWKARIILGMSSPTEDHTCSLVFLMLSLHRMFRCGRSTVWTTFVARGLRVLPRC